MLRHAIEPMPRILLIDDSEFDRRLLRHRLGREGGELFEAPNGRTGITLCQSERPDLVLLDLHLPDWDGFEVLRQLKDRSDLHNIPVIFLSATGKTEQRARGLDLGAVDFISKPFDDVELRARVRAALRTKRLQDMLEQRAHLDGLTGLSNRHALNDHLEREWSRCDRLGQAVSVILGDLDRFKLINDRYGHASGDIVLSEAADRLRQSVRESDFPARYGGEEFVVVAADSDLQGALAIAERFRTAVAEHPFNLGPIQIEVTVSLGVAIGHPPQDQPDVLMEHADQALYWAKGTGRNRVCLWNDGAVHHPSPIEDFRLEAVRSDGTNLRIASL